MTDPLAQAIGLIGYATDHDGIGGMIKARVTDFRVEEMATSIHLDNRGRFTVAKVSLTNWETNRFCNQLAAKLRIPRNRIFFAGTKDKRAVTSQLFVIDAPMNKVAQVELPDVDIEVLGRTHQKLDLVIIAATASPSSFGDVVTVKGVHSVRLKRWQKSNEFKPPWRRH